MSLMLCALDASGSSAFPFVLVAIDERLALKTVENRSSVRLRSRLRLQTSTSGRIRSTGVPRVIGSIVKLSEADACCVECDHEPQRPGPSSLPPC